MSSKKGHNPYFSRWFSAIPPPKIKKRKIKVTILILVDGFLQYNMYIAKETPLGSHNPYFSRWFSAICLLKNMVSYTTVTILILVDGFLQLANVDYSEFQGEVTILILVDGFLQCNMQ